MLSNCDAGEDSWESLWDQGNQTSEFYRRSILNILRVTDTVAAALIFWKSDEKSQLIGKDWSLKRLRAGGEGVTEDDMVGWHPELSGHECEQTPGDNKGQESLACCSPWGYRVEHDLATNNNDSSWMTCFVEA